MHYMLVTSITLPLQAASNGRNYMHYMANYMLSKMLMMMKVLTWYIPGIPGILLFEVFTRYIPGISRYIPGIQKWMQNLSFLGFR